MPVLHIGDIVIRGPDWQYAFQVSIQNDTDKSGIIAKQDLCSIVKELFGFFYMQNIPSFNLLIMIVKALQTAWTRPDAELLGVWSGSKLFATQPICLPIFK